MTNAPDFPSPLSVNLEELAVMGDNRIQVGAELGDGRELWLDFAPESEAARRILDLLSELMTEALSELGGRGVVVSGFTPPEADAE